MADWSTIAQEGLKLLGAFLEKQREYQAELRAAIARDGSLAEIEKEERTILEHFRLLQACDNLSLLTCVAFSAPADLLHPLPLNGGGTAEVKVTSIGPRHFRLTPWPFEEKELTFKFPARYVEGKRIGSSGELEAAFLKANEETLTVTLTA